MRRTSRWLRYLGLVLAAVITSGLTSAVQAPSARAQTTSDPLPSPVPAGPTCKWYGSMTWERVIDFDDATYEQNQHDREAMSMSSAPVAGYDCGMNWAADRDHSYNDVDQIYCGTFSYSREMSLAGNGQGHYTAGLVGSAEDGFHGSIFGYADGTMQGTQRDTVEDCTSPDGNGTTTTDVSQEAYDMPRGGRCDEGWTGSWQIDSRTVQAMVGSCSYNVVSTTDTNTTVHRETITWRFRRTDCDKTIDSDGDDLADCTEFSLQTDTQNPDTDGDRLTDGQEVLIRKTDPLDTDTDDGGIEDGNEADGATDPLDPTDDFMNCHYMNTSFIAGWQGDFDIEQPAGADPLHWMRYSWSDMRYCVDSAGVRLATTGSQEGTVNLPDDIAYFFQLLDFKVKYAGSNSVSVERLTNESLEAKVKGRFKFCSGIPVLGTIVGKGIKAVLKIVPDRFEKKLLEWGPRRIFESSLIPNWIKNEIVQRGFKAVLNSFDALSPTDHKAIMTLFKWLGEKVGGNFAQLVLGDLLCFTVWRPEIVATITADGASDTFAQGPTGPFEVMKDF